MKKLYLADGYAVKELLKVTSVLYNAVKTNTTNYRDVSADDSDSPVAFDLTAKVGVFVLICCRTVIVIELTGLVMTLFINIDNWQLKTPNAAML